MLMGIFAVSLGLALSAVPAWGQMGHQREHSGHRAGEVMVSDTAGCPGYGMMGALGAREMMGGHRGMMMGGMPDGHPAHHPESCGSR